MRNLQDGLIRASTVARLESLIACLENQGTDFTWDLSERDWFRSLLFPFSAEPDAAFRLADTLGAAAMDAAEIMSELISADEAISVEKLQQEFDGFARLYVNLGAERPQLDDADLQRALRVAVIARHRLLGDIPRHLLSEDPPYCCARA